MTPELRARSERLRAYCEAAAGKPFSWGVDDCSTWPAQWVADETGREVRWPDFASKEEADALVAAAGGLSPLWDDVARSAGIHPVFLAPDELPVLGDVGIILTTYHGDVGGIFAHGGIFCWRAETGVRMLGPRRHTIVKVWRLP